MPGTRKTGRRSNQRRGQQNNAATRQVSMVVYKGPLRPRADLSADDVYTVSLPVWNAVASSGAGVVDTVFAAGSQAQASPLWTNYSSQYSEWRILGMEVNLSPWNKYNRPTTENLAPVMSVIDRFSSSAIASNSQAISYGSVIQHDPSTKIRRVVRMDTIEEADFVAISNVPNDLMVKLYSSGNSNSITLYDYLNFVRVQFKGRIL